MYTPLLSSFLVIFLGTPASSTTKTGRHDIAEILLKVALRHQNHLVIFFLYPKASEK